MSSKRGRKRNDNLPPNRARDVQRAFRARRAAHLQALEARVAELELENDQLRVALRLPPSQRPPLGKGPTGKDKAKVHDSGTSHLLPFPSSRESSAVETPPSRETSASPSGMAVSMSHNSHPMTVIDPNNWDDSILLNEPPQHHTPSMETGSSDMAYHISPIPAPLSAPIANKQPLMYTYTPNFSSSSRSVPLYSETPAPYCNGTERAGGSGYGNSHFTPRGELRDEAPRPHYQYSPPFPSHETNVHSQSPSPNINHAPSHQNHDYSQHNHHVHHPPSHRESPLPYNPHRRTQPDNQNFPSLGQGFPELPNPTHAQANGRSTEYPRQSEHLHAHPGPPRYHSDGRLNPLP